MSETERPSTARLVAAFAAVYIIWGSTYLAIRFAIETLPGFLMAGVRFLAAGAILYAWARLRGAEAPTRRHWVTAAVLGVLFLCFGNGGVVWAEERVPSGLTALLVAMVPAWTVGMQWLWPGGKRPTLMVLAGLVIGLAGVALLVFGGGEGGGRIDPIGAAILVAASVAWSFAGVLSPRLSHPRSSPLASGMQMLAGGATLLLVGLLTGEAAQVSLGTASPRSLLSVAYLVVFGSVVAFSAFAWLLRVSTPARASTYAFVNPAVAVFLGWVFAGERLAATSLLAAGVIIAAVVLITLGKAPRRARRAEPKAEGATEAA